MDRGEDSAAEPEMVLLAALVSRVEALVVGSMLEAAGILVDVGATHHASASVNSLALGGHRLWVPDFQYLEASEILLEVLGEEEWGFSRGLQRAVFRVAGFWALCYAAFLALASSAGLVTIFEIVEAPFAVLSVPVNPQGRGDYFLHPEAA